jgi:tRNA threonylcarbamoyladenosine biosynthesis protein TsaB
VKLLAFDTSTSACSVAIFDSAKDCEQQITSHIEIMPMQQGKLILPMIDAALAKAEIALNELDAICYGQGPGSYTGLRISASVAQGLGFALNCPLIAVSSLAAAAQAAYQRHGWGKILVAQDARAQEIYWAAFSLNAEKRMCSIGTEQVTSPAALATPFSGQEWHGVGDAWQVYGEILNKSVLLAAEKIETKPLLLAEAIVMLAKEKYSQQQWVSARDAVPVYLR